jgi:hypothetical protein
MIYKFKCKVAGDVLMTGPVGDHLLQIIGKPAAAQGILQPGDLPAAMQALHQAAAAEGDSHVADVKTDASAGAAGTDDADTVTLRQHVWPLIEMMKQAHAADEPIVWGV